MPIETAFHRRITINPYAANSWDMPAAKEDAIETRLGPTLWYLNMTKVVNRKIVPSISLNSSHEILRGMRDATKRNLRFMKASSSFILRSVEGDNWSSSGTIPFFTWQNLGWATVD